MVFIGNLKIKKEIIMGRAKPMTAKAGFTKNKRRYGKGGKLKSK